MRDYARDLIASAMSFVRGHGGSGGANAPVGAAFVIGALIVAVLGLRWISASGDSEKGTDETPWEFAEAGSVNPSTTIPASTPADVVPIKDPDAGDTPATTATTQPGIFLPGFTPTPGGGEGPTTTQGGTTPTTKPGGGTTAPTNPSTSGPSTTPSTGPSTTPSTGPSTTPSTTEPPTTTSTTVDTEPTVDLSDVAKVRISQRFDALGWPLS